MLKVGTRLRLRGDGFFFKRLLREHGSKFVTVIDLHLPDPNNPIEDHGYIVIKFDKSNKEESFAYTGWEEHFKVLEES